MITITDITGASIEVTDLDAAIKQCRMCRDSHYKMSSGHAVGENYAFMLTQLEAIKQRQRRERWLASTKKRYDEGKRFTKSDMGYEIGRHEAYHPASLYWHHYTREQMTEHFNRMFGTDISKLFGRVSARFFFHEPKSDAVKKKQKAGYIIFLFIDKGNDLQVSDF